MNKLGVLVMAGLCVTLCSCQRTPGGVMNKVLVDFGLRAKPEGYVSGSDQVFQRLPAVAKAELSRLNQASRQGEVKFQEGGDLKGRYYKQAKRYENYYPLDVRPASGGAQKEGYVGLIEYSYRTYQGTPKASRAEAEAQPADMATGETGRETYRYSFSSTGVWNGAKGEKVRR